MHYELRRKFNKNLNSEMKNKKWLLIENLLDIHMQNVDRFGFYLATIKWMKNRLLTV